MSKLSACVLLFMAFLAIAAQAQAPAANYDEAKVMNVGMGRSPDELAGADILLLSTHGRTRADVTSAVSHQPVCWNCHIVQTFRREHPEMIVERKER